MSGKSFSVLTWNIACLPKLINSLRDPLRKADEIFEKALSSNADVICFQEVFDYTIQRKAVEIFKDHGYHIHYSIENDSYIPRNGLFTACKFKMKTRKVIDYNESVGIEKWVNKGLLTCEFIHPSLGDVIIHNTHLQSDTEFWPWFLSEKCRRRQIETMTKHLNPCTSALTMLVGDLNDTYSIVKQKYIKEIGFSTMNEEQIVTYPKKNKQLDYVVLNRDNHTVNYQMLDGVTNDLSDHNIVVCDIKLDH
jgi:endonuclease/exonuclease/phosphatase family metal-dependent hydrolase